MLVLDSGAVTKLAKRSRQNAALIAVLRREDLWPPLVPATVLVEFLTGRPGPDANANRLLADVDDLTALAAHSADVTVERI